MAQKKPREWEDITSYSRGQTDRTPRSWSLGVGIFRVVVSRWIHGDKDKWYLSCDPLAERRELKAKDIIAAQEEALDLLWSAIEEAQDEIVERNQREPEKKKAKKKAIEYKPF